MEEPSQNQIAQTVAALLRARTWEESKHIVEAQRATLLTDAADQFLASLIEQNKDDATGVRLLGELGDLLLHCRHNGIEVVYADLLREERLKTLLVLIEQRTDPRDMPQRIVLCQNALQLVHRDTQPELWAHLQDRLALSLFRNLQGEQAENMEQAIAHFEQALEVYTQEFFPEEWARTQFNLGDVYRLRIRGERGENLEEAIDHLEQALLIRTRQAFPQDWARTQFTLGNAFRDCKRGEHAENIEKSIFHYQQALEVYTRQDFPQYWAMTQNNLGNTYQQRMRGERADNLEQIILHYQQALEIYTRQAFPLDWAGVQHNLGIAYSERMSGERAENLEQAITHYEQALLVRTRQVYPLDWAKTQNNLANAYIWRIQGERAENVEQAIAHYEQAMEVYTRQSFPKDWAMLQNGLGNAYQQRIRGERAENLEQAISYFEHALEVCSSQAFPQEWASTQNNLGIAYNERIRGEQAENLEQAIAHYERALLVRDRQGLPRDWAKTQHNLAVTYIRRIRGERADNIEHAIAHFEQALEVYTRRDFPQDWAMVQNGLGIAYAKRIHGEPTDNGEQAISHLEKSLEVRTRKAFPQHWAETQSNLGMAYYVRLQGERAANLERAIAYFEQALTIYTRQTFPQDWADLQNNLGLAYSERVRGEHADDVEQAIFHFQHALEISTPLTFPLKCRDSAYWLGRLLYDEGRFPEARQALETAHQAVETLRGEAQRDLAKRSLAERTADLYARLVSCCIKEGDETTALLYAAAGKGRAFVDLLATARLDLTAASVSDPELAADLLQAQNLRRQIDNLLAPLTGESKLFISTSSADNGGTPSIPTTWSREALYAQLDALREEESRHWEEMAYKYPALTATQKVPILSVEQMRTLVAGLNATLVEYYCHTEGWCAFIVRQNDMYYIPLPLVTDELLKRMARWMDRLNYPEGRNQLSYSRLFEWYDAIIAPLEKYLPQNQPVVLAPFGLLHVLPLAAARHRKSGRYVAEDYQVSFAPSLSALSAVWQQACRAGTDGQETPHRLLNVAYPGAPNSDRYLPNVLPEAEAIARHFSQVTPLYQEKAAPNEVLAHSREQDAVHFGCHGWFDLERPEQSGLLLSGGWLTVQRIMTELRLFQARVATLGACLSGREALQRGDEHVGLLQAMLTSGVQAVVASLWPVDDAATRAMFETFYAELVAGRSPARAMQEAARSVRAQPGWEHPYYWAAFQVSGLALGSQEPEQTP